MKENKKGVLLDCQNCRYVWIYAGKNTFYGQCPMCLYRVNIKKRLKFL